MRQYLINIGKDQITLNVVNANLNYFRLDDIRINDESQRMWICKMPFRYYVNMVVLLVDLT